MSVRLCWHYQGFFLPLRDPLRCPQVYQMLTQTLPEEAVVGTNPMAFIYAMKAQDFLFKNMKQLPPAAHAFVTDCLAPDAAKRPPAADLLDHPFLRDRPKRDSCDWVCDLSHSSPTHSSRAPIQNLSFLNASFGTPASAPGYANAPPDEPGPEPVVETPKMGPRRPSARLKRDRVLTPLSPGSASTATWQSLDCSSAHLR